MKTKISLLPLFGFIILFSLAGVAFGAGESVSAEQTVTPEIRAMVEACYEGSIKAFEAEDMDAFMTYFTDDYQALFYGIGRDAVRKQMEKVCESFDDLKMTVTNKRITRTGDLVQVIEDLKIEGRPQGQTESRVIQESVALEILREEYGELKTCQSAVMKKSHVEYVNGQTYRNENVGFSFTVPEGWVLVPFEYPVMLESAIFFKPGSNTVGLLGYLEIPYNTGAKAALDADSMMMKRLTKDTYEQLLECQETSIAGVTAYEDISKFGEDGSSLRQRRRVYFDAGGLLYTFIFDAMPAMEWKEVESDFQTVLDSFTFMKEGGEDAVLGARKLAARGSVAEGIYSNEEMGCQIAAPEGWSIEASNIGPNSKFSVNMKPPSGDSVVRCLAVDVKGAVSLEKALDEQIKATEQLAEDTETGPVEDIQIGSRQGKTVVQSFSIKGFASFKRKVVMVLEGDILYVIHCDAIPPEKYDEREAQFDEIVASFTLN